MAEHRDAGVDGVGADEPGAADPTGLALAAVDQQLELEAAGLARAGTIVAHGGAVRGDSGLEDAADVTVQVGGLLPCYPIRGARGVDARREQRLIGIDVSHTCHLPLVHQHFLHRLAALPQCCEELPTSPAIIEWLGTDCGVILGPATPVEEEQGAESADVAVDQLAAALERRTEDGVLSLRGGERTAVDLEGAGHAGLDYQAVRREGGKAGGWRFPGEVQDGVLGAARNRFDPGAGEGLEQATAGDAAEDVVVGEARGGDGAPLELRPDVPDDGLDFGELGHALENRWLDGWMAGRSPRRVGRVQPRRLCTW